MQTTQPAIVTCKYCERDWPAETSAPKPGSVTTATNKTGIKGHWDRTVIDINVNPDGSDDLVFSDWYFVGPCCELTESWWAGFFDEDEHDDPDDLDAHPIQCAVCGGEMGESWSTCDCEDGPTDF